MLLSELGGARGLRGHFIPIHGVAGTPSPSLKSLPLPTGFPRCPTGLVDWCLLVLALLYSVMRRLRTADRASRDRRRIIGRRTRSIGLLAEITSSESDEGGKLLHHVGLVAIDESVANLLLFLTTQFHPELANWPIKTVAALVGHDCGQVVDLCRL